jgi:hypothetical protein
VTYDTLQPVSPVAPTPAVDLAMRRHCSRTKDINPQLVPIYRPPWDQRLVGRAPASYHSEQACYELAYVAWLNSNMGLPVSRPAH